MIEYPEYNFLNNTMLNNFNKTNLHDRCQITEIQFLNNFQDQIVSIGHNYIINVYDIQRSTTINSNNLKSTYLTSVHTNPNFILVGDGNGSLMTLDPKTLTLVDTKHLHSDCISDILEEQNHFITVGNDGIVNFVDKRKFQIFKSIDVKSPIKQIVKHQGKYYLAGVQAFVMDKEHNVENFGSFNTFLSHNERLYGCNDPHGFVYVSMKDRKYVPCERMVGYKDGILGTSWGTVNYFKYDSLERISWKSTKAKGFQKGDSIASLLTKNNIVFGGAESGNLYIFSFDETYSWLYD